MTSNKAYTFTSILSLTWFQTQVGRGVLFIDTPIIPHTYPI